MPNRVTVQATEEKYRILRHEPTGATFDKDGRSSWPYDQFTLRLIEEGSIKVVDEKTTTKPLQEPELKPSGDVTRKDK